MNDNAHYTSLKDAVALGLDLRFHKSPAIVNLYTAVRNRLKAHDTTNMHDPIILQPHCATEKSFSSVFTDPADGARYMMVVSKLNG